MTRLAFLALIAILGAAQNASPPLDAKASDPVVMGWMVGSPPPANKIIRFSDSTFFRFPQTRWSYSNIRQLMPTRVVARGDAPVAPLSRAERKDLDGIWFHPLGSTDWMTWARSLDANYTDGILVLHKGRVVYERYFGALSAEKQHIAFSVTKSFVSTLAAALISEGVLDEKATVSRYVPELKSSGFADATLRHLLDMTTGMRYTENYADENSPVWEFSRAIGFLPRPANYRGPETSGAYLATVGKEYPHGERFAYKTINTDALAWVRGKPPWTTS
jgi:CubicO group peptidase (beta-lactamase class C family)